MTRERRRNAGSKERSYPGDPSHRPFGVRVPRRVSDVELGPVDGNTGLHLRPRSPATPNALGTHGARLRKPKAQGKPCDCFLTDPETGVASGKTKAAICVQDVDVQCVLQFTLIHAAGCALHRHTSRVIHRLELSLLPNR